jgi:acetoin utilization deacetylase AcuC-like enzyme
MGWNGSRSWIAVFNKVLRPALAGFRPEAVIISAGFDAHHDDPLAGMALTAEGYIALTRVVKDIAGEFSRGRVLSCLEGGYNLDALAASVEGHLRALEEA